MRLLICGIRLSPSSVSEYSTFGGISGYIFRLISLSASRLLNVSVSTFGDMSGIVFPMVLNRVFPFSERTHNIRSDHFPEKCDMTFLTGQDSVYVNFFRFSCSRNTFIFNNSYLFEIALHFCKLLQLLYLWCNFALS